MEPCSQTSCSLLHSDLMQSGCFCSQRMMAKLSTSGCSRDRLYTWLRGDNWSVSSCYFTSRERSQLNLFVFVKKHLWHSCLFMYHFRQARLHKDAAPKTQGQTETDTQINKVKFHQCFQPSIIFSPAVDQIPLSLFRVCHVGVSRRCLLAVIQTREHLIESKR